MAKLIVNSLPINQKIYIFLTASWFENHFYYVIIVVKREKQGCEQCDTRGRMPYY